MSDITSWIKQVSILSGNLYEDDTILGPTIVCAPGTAVYSVPNLPPNATVTWNTEGIQNTITTRDGDSIEISVGANTAIQTNFMANVTDSYGIRTSFSTNVVLGTPINGYYIDPITDENEQLQISPPNFVPAGYLIEVHYSWPNVSNLTTSVNPNSVTVNLYPSSNEFDIFVPSQSSSVNEWQITLSGIRTCDNTPISQTFLFLKSSTSTSGVYSLSPNPATSSINIQPAGINAVNSTSSISTINMATVNKTSYESVPNITQVIIYNNMGKLVQVNNFDGTTNHVKLSLSSILVPGIYYVNIVSGAYKEKKILQLK